MKASRITNLILSASLAGTIGGGSVVGADPIGAVPGSGAVDLTPGVVSALIQPGRPVLDHMSPWLMSAGWPMDRLVRLVEAGRRTGPLASGLSSWRLADRSLLEAEQIRNMRFAGRVELGDPRLIGWLTLAWSRDVYLASGASASVEAVELRLDGAGGSWVGSLTGIGVPATGMLRLTGTLLGSGAYDGLAAVVSLAADGADGAWAIDGLVVAGLATLS